MRAFVIVALFCTAACGETATDEPPGVDAGQGDADAAPQTSVCKALADNGACCAVSDCFWLSASDGVGDACLAYEESCGPVNTSALCETGQVCLLRHYYLDQRGECEPHPSDDVPYPIGVCVPDCPEGTIEYTMTNGAPGCKVDP